MTSLNRHIVMVTQSQHDIDLDGEDVANESIRNSGLETNTNIAAKLAVWRCYYC